MLAVGCGCRGLVGGCASSHERTVVAAALVVADKPGAGFGLELTDRVEVATVKRWPPALLQHGSLERDCPTLGLPV
jgi:hypothetical protein